MTRETDVDARLRSIDPAPPQRRDAVGDTEWGRAMRNDIVAGSPSRRPPRIRRWAGAVAATATALAIAGLMAVLILTTGHDAPATAGRQTVLVAAPDVGGRAVSPAALRASAAILVERARLIGIAGVSAVPRGGAIDLTVPDDAPADLVTWLRAPGRLTIVPDERLPGRAATSLDAAVRRAQAAAGAAVVGGGLEAVPRGYVVARMDASATIRGPVVPTYVVYRRVLPLTETAVASARVDPSSPQPVVDVRFTPAGTDRFEALTRRAAQYGLLRGRVQGIAIILDDRLISNPVIDYETNPSGLRSTEAQIPIVDGLDARAVAAELSRGPLPLRLTPPAAP